MIPNNLAILIFVDINKLTLYKSIENNKCLNNNFKLELILLILEEIREVILN